MTVSEPKPQYLRRRLDTFRSGHGTRNNCLPTTSEIVFTVLRFRYFRLFQVELRHLEIFPQNRNIYDKGKK